MTPILLWFSIFGFDSYLVTACTRLVHLDLFIKYPELFTAQSSVVLSCVVPIFLEITGQCPDYIHSLTLNVVNLENNYTHILMLHDYLSSAPLPT